MTHLAKLLLVVLCLVGVRVGAQPVFPPASQNEVNAGLLHTKFVAPDTLRGFSGFLINSNGFLTSSNFTPFAAAISRDTAFDFIQFTNFTKLFTNFSSSINTNLEPNVAGTNGYIRITNSTFYDVSFYVNFRNHTNIGAARTNIFVVTTNIVAGGTNQTGIAATFPLNAVNSVVGNVSARGLLFLPSNTFVNLGFLSTTALATNNVSVESAKLMVQMVPNALAGTFNVVGGGLSGLTTNGNQFGANTTLTIKDGAALTNISVGNLPTNSVLVVSRAGFVTNAFKTYFIETNNSPQAISNIIAGASFGDKIQFGAGTYNLGFQSLRPPKGVTISGQGIGATRIVGFGSLFTNGPVIIIQSSNVVEDLDIIRSTAGDIEITTAAIGFNYTRNDGSLVDSAATNWVIRNIRCLNWTTDALYFAHTNQFYGLIDGIESYARTDNLVVTGVGLHEGATNWVDVRNSKFINTGHAGSDCVPIRVTVGNVALHNVTAHALNGNNAYAIKGSGTNTSRIYVYGGDYRATGTNTVEIVNTTSTFDPTNVVIYTFGNPFVKSQTSAGSIVLPTHGSYSNLVVTGTLDVAGLTSLVDANVSDDLTIGAQGAIFGEYLAAYPRVAYWDASGILTNVTSADPGNEYVKADGTTGVPSGGSGGTNFPPVIHLGGGGAGTNVAVASGVRQFVTVQTNASFALNFQGTPRNGEEVTVGVSNFTSSIIYLTNFQGGAVASVFDPIVASNVTTFAIPATSERYMKFVFHTNFNLGTVRQELVANLGVESELAFGANLEASTNGLLIRLSTTTNQLYLAPTNLNFAVLKPAISNSVATTNIFGVLHKAAATPLFLDANHGRNFTITNRYGAASTIVLTNMWDGDEVTIVAIGEVSGGAARVITIIGHGGGSAAIADLDNFGTAIAASKAFTLTNGNAVEISARTTRMLESNVTAIVTRQFAY